MANSNIRRPERSAVQTNLVPAFPFSPQDANDAVFVSLKDSVADSDGKYQDPFTGKRIQWDEDAALHKPVEVSK